MELAEPYDDRFHMPKRMFITLVLLSVVWFSFDGIPVFPVGLFFTLRYVGRNFEVTFLRSLVTGWYVVVPSIVCTAISWHAGIRIDFSTVGGIGLSLSATLPF